MARYALTKDQLNTYIHVEGVTHLVDNGGSIDFKLNNVSHNVGKHPSRIVDGRLYIQRWLIDKKLHDWQLQWHEPAISVCART